MKKHAAGKTHLSKIEQEKLYFRKPDQNITQNIDSVVEVVDLTSAVPLASFAAARPSSSSLNEFIVKEDFITAEIMWAIDKVVRRISLRDGEESANLFKHMFPDNIIAKKFNMHKDKLSYVVTYGLGPYFQNEISKIVKQCPFFSIFFYESLNKVAQKEQMDLHVRYWDSEAKKVSTRYLTSTFLGHACWRLVACVCW